MNLARAYPALSFLLATTACDLGPGEDDLCPQAGVEMGIIGQTLRADCDDSAEPCPMDQEIVIFDHDPNETSGTDERVTELDSMGDYEVELDPGTYHVCRFLGDTAYHCADPVTLTAEQPVFIADYVFDAADSYWTADPC